MKRQSSESSRTTNNEDYYTGYSDKGTPRSIYDPELNGSVKMKLKRQNSSSSSINSSFRNNTNIAWKILFLVQYIAFAYVTVNSLKAHSSLRKKSSMLSQATERYSNLYEKYSKKERALQETHDDFTSLNLKLKAIASIQHENENENVTNSEERQRVTNTFIGRYDAQQKRLTALKGAIQKIELKNLEGKFGKGPYGIEVCVIMEGERKFFTIQTAPNELAPHTIRTFMEMVHHKIWDETIFYHQAEHVAVGVPVNIKGEKREGEFVKSLLFPEYSEKFPHKENTIGFQGNPGGPEFYINIDDNTNYHGPGKQAYDAMEEGESCFGKIVRGMDVVQKFQAINRKAGETENGVLYTSIQSMRIVRLS